METKSIVEQDDIKIEQVDLEELPDMALMIDLLTLVECD